MLTQSRLAWKSLLLPFPEYCNYRCASPHWAGAGLFGYPIPQSAAPLPLTPEEGWALSCSQRRSVAENHGYSVSMLSCLKKSGYRRGTDRESGKQSKCPECAEKPSLGFPSACVNKGCLGAKGKPGRLASGNFRIARVYISSSSYLPLCGY